jgi:hypothetical protein
MHSLFMKKNKFTCNTCGRRNFYSDITELGRETPTCRRCGSTVRMRAVIHLLSSELYGEGIESLRVIFPAACREQKELACEIPRRLRRGSFIRIACSLPNRSSEDLVQDASRTPATTIERSL